MNTYVTTFGTSQYQTSINMLGMGAAREADFFIPYTDKDIESSFYKKNEHIFKYPRGYGYWIWKPYIILKTMSKMVDGDICLYSDAGVYIVSSLKPLFELCKKNNGIYLFDNRNVHPKKEPWHNSPWVKGDCFALMDCDIGKYHNGKHVDAAFQLYQKTPKTIEFLNEYQSFCENINIISDLPNIKGINQPDFYDHRHDQSILSLLAIKHGITLGREPSQWGNEGINENSEYGMIFHHHRNR